MTEKITAIIKTKNADRTLCNILESIKFVDEIIAVDDNSKDDTIEILKEYKAKIIYYSYNELNQALNQALEEASGDWILVVNQDEIVPSNLAFELKKYIQKPKKNRFSLVLNQKVFYCNKELKCASNWVLRFFKKDYCLFLDNNSTKISLNKGKTHKIKSPLYKYLEQDIISQLEGELSYSKEKIHLDSRNPKIFLAPFFVFIDFYFFKKGFLDKKLGLIYSLKKAFLRFVYEVIKFEEREKNDC